MASSTIPSVKEELMSKELENDVPVAKESDIKVEVEIDYTFEYDSTTAIESGELHNTLIKIEPYDENVEFDCYDSKACIIPSVSHNNSSNKTIIRKDKRKVTTGGKPKSSFEVKAYSCKSCFTRFRKESSLLVHIYRNRGKPFKCKKKRTRPNVFFQCDVCDKKYNYKQHLIRHMKGHFTCRFCSKTFPSPSEMDMHLYSHLEYKCKFCKKNFPDGISLRDHVDDTHGNKPYSCDVCQAKFPNKNSLNSHMVVHSDDRPFLCANCDKRFKTKAKLKAHHIMHVEERRYPCTLCQGRFKTLHRLNTHVQMVHTKLKYSCDICDKKYSKKCTLTAHKRTHTSDEPPYACEICLKRFNYKQALKKHGVVHTGEKPYPCNICQKRFSDSSNLRVHKRNQHAAGK